MKLNLITFASSLASRESIFTDHHELLDAIAERYDLCYIFPEDLDKPLPEGATMVLVGSGGVEEMVKANIDRLPHTLFSVHLPVAQFPVSLLSFSSKDNR